MGIGLYVFFLFIKKNISLRCSKTNDKNTFARDWKAEINNDFDCGSSKPPWMSHNQKGKFIAYLTFYTFIREDL